LKYVQKVNHRKKIIFPGAVVYYKEKSLPVKLLNQQIGLPPEQVIHNSITSLEFNFVNTFRKLSEKKKPSIAFIQGHGELDEQHTADIFATLSEYYDVKTHQPSCLQGGCTRQY
jgi:ABC-2 type transport system permease protein